MKMANEPVWDIGLRLVWPRSFHRGTRAVMWAAAHLDRGTEGPDRARLPEDDIWLRILSYCTRDWFAPLTEGEAATCRPPTVYHCDWCQMTPREVPGVLRRCVGCNLVWYCSEECNVAGWNCKVNPHKAVCEAEQARLKEVMAAEAKPGPTKL